MTTVATNFSGGASILGDTSGNAVPAGYVGEHKVASLGSGSGTALSVTSTQWTDIVSIQLTNGIWDISYVCGHSNYSATGITLFFSGVSTTPGNDSTGISLGNNAIATPLAATADADATVSVPSYRVIVSSGPTTYYLKSRVDFTGGTVRVFGRISAVRAA